MNPVRAHIIEATRGALADAGLVDLDVVPARVVDDLARPLVMVRLDTIKPEPAAGKWRRQYGAALLVVHPIVDTGEAGTDELDLLVEDVLHALDVSRIRWTNAERVTLQETNGPAWEITLQPTPTQHQERNTP
jgi:hypothetical protein